MDMCTLVNSSQIESVADSGAEGCNIPTNTYIQFNLPLFDISEEDMVCGAGHKFDIIGGCYLTIEDTRHIPTCYKTSN